MATMKELGRAVGKYERGEKNHILDVPGGIGVAHRSFVNADLGICTGFTVVNPGPKLNGRHAAAVYALNASGELTCSHQIAEWGYLDTPIVLTNTPRVGKAYDSVSNWMMKKIPEIGGDVGVVIPVIGECDDSVLSDPHVTAWIEADLFDALDEAHVGSKTAKHGKTAFLQGGVGAGTGTITYDLKGGIGSSSRKIKVNGQEYTIGILVQTNFGLRDQLTILGKPVGQTIKRPLPKQHKEGSCIGVLATDAPLDPHALKRLAVRMGLGLARTGSHAHHGSGEIFLAFSTAKESKHFMDWDRDEWNPFLQATVEATEEAVYNALLSAKPVSNSRATVAALMPATEAELF